ncbi:hypothetical protein C427_4001 [Paraglaciecola psychrophila 170]|uniref:Uncharacterized protein n=1 Tax=Paraglaciecola psychrophila 170 TaxID=1129794 RepID=K6ZIE0_9ALTE|nr:hypothetical protein C427_4001 [Paraglaciecola psychrophila 170]GAC35751.1 hypothetical protein GPSY_0109 [Paraglaciecola psychrophila 170]
MDWGIYSVTLAADILLRIAKLKHEHLGIQINDLSRGYL